VLGGRYGLELVAATDVDNPLLGPNGASAVFGPQKGADRAMVLDLDDELRAWADVVERDTAQPGLRDRPGAGAAGGLGFALFALGASRASGLDVVAAAVRLARRIADAELVVTGEGRFDSQSLRGKVPAGVARLAQEHGLPCVVIAGQAEVGRRDAAAMGVEEIVTVAEDDAETGAVMPDGAVAVAVAVFATLPASTSACVRAYSAVHVTVPAGCRSVGGQVTVGAVPDPVKAVSSTDGLARSTVPVLVMRNE